MLELYLFEEFFNEEVNPVLQELKHEIEKELKIRKKVQKEGDINKVHTLNKKIKTLIKKQRTIFHNLKNTLKNTNMPALEKHNKTQNLLKQFGEILNKE